MWSSFWKKLRRQPASVMPKLRDLVEDVLAVSEPPQDFTVSVGAPAVVVGFLKRSREFLQSMLALAQAGLGHSTDPLARAVIDLGATGTWLMKNPESNLARLLGGLRWDWNQMRTEHEKLHASFPVSHDPEFDHFMDPGNQEAPKMQRMPTMKELANSAGLGMWYVSYRLISMRSHATMLASPIGEYSEEARAFLVDRGEEPRLAETYIRVAIWMTLKLTELANEYLGWRREKEVSDLVKRALEGVTNLSG